MAEIYVKTASDTTNILEPRECYFRPFDFDDWTEMRMGFYLTGVNASNDNTAPIAENVVISTVADRLTIGIKNSDTNDLPGVAGSLFLGIVTPTGITTDSAVGTGYIAPGSPGNRFASAGYAGATLVGGTTSEALVNAILNMPPDPSLASAYNAFFGLKFVINNIGLSSQSVSISAVITSVVSGTDYSASALRTAINNATYGAANTVAWNDGAAARAIPDAVWFRLPFYNNRIRLSQPSPMMVRYAP